MIVRLDDIAFLAENFPECRRRRIFSDLSKYFYAWLEERMKTQKNAIISVIGKTGYGKSFAAIYLGMYLSKMYGMKFDASHIFFTCADLVERLKTAKDGETFMQDEQVGLERIGEGSMSEKLALDSIEATVRVRQINLIFCSPELRSHVNHWVIEAQRIDDKKKTCRHAICSVRNDTLHPFGRIYTGCPNDAELLKEYDKRKQAFIDAVLNQEVRDPASKWEEIAQEFCDKYLERYLGMFSSKKELQTLIIKYFKGLTMGEYGRIADMIIMSLAEKGIDWRKKKSAVDNSSES